MKRTTKTKDRTSRRDEDYELETVPASELTQFRSFVLYGRSATGKTTLSCTFPGPRLLLDIRDQGTDSITDVEDVQVKQVNEFDELDDIYWWLKRKENRKKFKTVIIDTVSQAQQLLIKDILESKGSGKRFADWGTMVKRDWGDISAQMKELIINYRDLSLEGMNVVFIAQDRVFNFDEETDTASNDELQPEVGPQLMPSVAKTLNAAVSMIGNTYIRHRIIVKEDKERKGKKIRKERIEYCLRVGPSPVYMTKVRKPRSIMVPQSLIDPTYEEIMDLIKGKE